MTAEVERAFELAPGQDLPALPGLGDSRELALEATYYDTRHFALTRARHVLLRCVGGDDEGWHVKLPGGDVVARVVREAGEVDPRDGGVAPQHGHERRGVLRVHAQPRVEGAEAAQG